MDNKLKNHHQWQNGKNKNFFLSMIIKSIVFDLCRSETEHKLLWKVPYVNNGTGNLSASVRIMEMNTSENADEEEPWTTSSIVKASFIGENALFSSIDFDLIGRSYRISLLKKKILSGKYQSEPDQSEPISFFKRPTKSSVTDKSLNPSDI
jgi:hypothetical protein